MLHSAGFADVKASILVLTRAATAPAMANYPIDDTLRRPIALSRVVERVESLFHERTLRSGALLRFGELTLDVANERASFGELAMPRSATPRRACWRFSSGSPTRCFRAPSCCSGSGRPACASRSARWTCTSGACAWRSKSWVARAISRRYAGLGTASQPSSEDNYVSPGVIKVKWGSGKLAPASALQGHRMGNAEKTRLRTVFVSDVHLGSNGCRADLLLEFLKSVDVDYLFLVGDIVDLWAMRKNFYWPQEHNNVLRTILSKAKKGTRVIYVPGNHDEDMREFCGTRVRQSRDPSRVRAQHERRPPTAGHARRRIRHRGQVQPLAREARLDAPTTSRWASIATSTRCAACSAIRTGRSRAI